MTAASRQSRNSARLASQPSASEEGIKSEFKESLDLCACCLAPSAAHAVPSANSRELFDTSPALSSLALFTNSLDPCGRCVLALPWLTSLALAWHVAAYRSQRRRWILSTLTCDETLTSDETCDEGLGGTQRAGCERMLVRSG
jgi:hypothetical protein